MVPTRSQLPRRRDTETPAHEAIGDASRSRSATPSEGESAGSDCHDDSNSCDSSSGNSSANESVSEAEESVLQTVKVGDELHHELLGMVKVVQLVSEGCEEWLKNKIQVELRAKVGVRSKCTKRWVCADYLTAVKSKTKSNSTLLEINTVGFRCYREDRKSFR